MDADYWRRRWADHRTGWQLSAPNPHLVAHEAVLEGAQRIVVPLCGKTVDLGWLAGRESAPSVVGIELVEEAARAFFAEQGLPVHRTHDGPLVRYEGGTVEIVVGDFFDVSADDVGRFDGALDRAALVAMSPSLQPQYVAHLRTLLEPGARVLLVTFEHDVVTDEPPFSVSEADVRRLWSGCAIERIDAVDAFAGSSFQARGASYAREAVYRIELPA